MNGTHYIAMELVDGETVREMLASGPIPFRKAVAIASQIGDALAKAQVASVISRGSQEAFLSPADVAIANHMELHG